MRNPCWGRVAIRDGAVTCRRSVGASCPGIRGVAYHGVCRGIGILHCRALVRRRLIARRLLRHVLSLGVVRGHDTLGYISKRNGGPVGREEGRNGEAHLRQVQREANSDRQTAQR